MKKLIYILIVVFFLSSLAACQNKDNKKIETMEEPDYYNIQSYDINNKIISTVWQAKYLSGDFYIAGSAGSNSKPVISKFNIQGNYLGETVLASTETISSIEDFCFRENGNLSCLNVHFQQGKNEGDRVYSFSYICFDSSGKEISCVPLKFPEGELTSFLTGFIMEENDNICILEDHTLFLFDIQGNLIKQYKINKDKTETAVMDRNGTIFLCSSSQKIALKQFDLSMEKIEIVREYQTGLPAVNKLWISAAAKDNDYDFIIGNQQGVYGYSCKGERTIKLLEWTDYDIVIREGHLLDFIYLEEGSYAFLVDKGQEGTCLFTAFKQEKTQDNSDKTELVLYGSPRVPDYVKLAAAAWNKQQEDCRITIKEATEGSSDLSLDIVSGKGPDIICRTPDLFGNNLYALAEKEYFVDYYDMMEQENEGFQKKDLLDNIRQIFETEDGKLYFLPISFSIESVLAGSKQDIQGREQWTLQDVEELMEQKPAKTTVIASHLIPDKKNFFRNLFDRSYDDFYDSTEGLKMKSFQKLLDFTDQWWIEGNDIRDHYLLAAVRGGGIDNVGIILKELDEIYGKNNYDLIGYPCENGTGIVIQEGVSFSIAANAKTIKAAWEFVQSFYSWEAQTNVFSDEEHPFAIGTSGFSIRKDVLQEQFKRIKKDRNTAVSKKEIEKFQNYVEHADRSIEQAYNDVTDMVWEEVQAYYNGDKGQEEMLNILENRIKLYTNEKK